MTPCERMTDRMPEVAAGLHVWTAVEAGHLAACADCAAEWRLVQLVRNTPARMDLDPARVAAGVRRRLAAPAEGRVLALRRRPLVRVVAALAAAALLVVALRPVLFDREVPAVDPGSVLTELRDLDSRELTQILDDWAPAESGPPVAAFVSGLGDLSADELEVILQGLET